jgi:NAD(P)H dehydrogenase (quinone)
MPAMLKGYFDRVWAPGTAFTHDLQGGRIKPLLTNIRLFGVVTTYGSPWWLTRLVMQDPGRKVLFRALKPMCGPAVRSFYLAHYDMDRSTAASRKAFEERVRARVSQL